MKILNDRSGSAVLIALIAMGVGMTLLVSQLSRRSYQQGYQQSEETGSEVDFLFGSMVTFLNNTGPCIKNFGVDYSSAFLNPTQLKKTDDSVGFETMTSSPTASYVNGRLKIQSIGLKGFTPDAAGSLEGTGTLTVTFAAQRQVTGSALFTRSVPVDITKDVTDKITSCHSLVNSDQFWKLDANGAHYTGGKVGIMGLNDSSATLKVTGDNGSPGVKQNTIFGSQRQGGISFCHSGDSSYLSVPAGNEIAFYNDLAKSPVTISPFKNAVGVNYPSGANLDHAFNLRSTDGTPYLNFGWTGQFDSVANPPRWEVAPDTASPPNGHLMFKPVNIASPVMFIHHPNFAGGKSADVRIGSDAARSAPDYVFYVFGVSGGIDDWQNVSDIRLKKNIRLIEGAIEKVSRLNGYFFRWKDPARAAEREMGLIAQELVEKNVATELVDCSSRYCTLQYAPMTALLTEAVKETHARERKIEERLKKLKQRLGGEKGE